MRNVKCEILRWLYIFPRASLLCPVILAEIALSSLITAFDTSNCISHYLFAVLLHHVFQRRISQTYFTDVVILEMYFRNVHISETYFIDVFQRRISGAYFREGFQRYRRMSNTARKLRRRPIIY